MRMIIMGAPGSGKGTHAGRVCERLHIPHIATGDIFRKNIENGTALGKKAQEYMDKGELVPDELTIAIMKDRLQQEDCKNGFLLDGFPRTIPQAEYLDEVMDALAIQLEVVLMLEGPDEEVIRRISGRRVCLACNTNYHVAYKPPKVENKCDACQTDLIIRDDDTEQTIRNRLAVYHKQTAPLLAYFEKKGLVKKVIGQEKVDDTTAAVFKALGV